MALVSSSVLLGSGATAEGAMVAKKRCAAAAVVVVVEVLRRIVRAGVVMIVGCYDRNAVFRNN